MSGIVMTARIASAADGLALRHRVAVNLFDWTFRFGVAIDRRCKDVSRSDGPRALRHSDVPRYLWADLGLIPEKEKTSVHEAAVRILFFY